MVKLHCIITFTMAPVLLYNPDALTASVQTERPGVPGCSYFPLNG